MNKKLSLIFGITLILLVLPLITGAEFDNVKSYDEITKTATIKNAFGLPNYLGGYEIAKVQLKSDLNVQVGLGYQKVFEYTIDSYVDYTNFIQELEIYNLKAGNTKENKKIDLKYLTYETIDVPIYETTCKELAEVVKGGNSTECTETQIGTEKQQRERWVDVAKMDVKVEKLTISGWTDVKQGDYYEWIPEFAGVKVQEWATWSGNMSVGLRSYWKFDETSGTTVYDSMGLYNGTITNAQVNQAGKLGKAIAFDGNGDYINLTNVRGFSGANPVSQSMWVYNKNSTSFQYITELGKRTLNKMIAVIENYDANNLSRFSTDYYTANTWLNATWTSNQWTHLVYTYDGTTVLIYQDGVLIGSQAKTLNLVDEGFVVGTHHGFGGSWFNGSLDEIALWNRTLTATEIALLYNDGDGCQYGNESCYVNIPAITLNSPINAYNSSSSSITFNATANSTSGITNVSLYLNGVLNETNTSGINATSYLFTKTISDGDHNWSIKSCNTDGCATSPTRTFTIDTTYPQIVLNYPTSLLDYGYINQTLQLNFTATDLHLDKCIYNYNGTNISIAGCQTGVYNISNITLSNKKNVTFYVNDTFGNMNSTTISWDYKVFENSRTYDSTTFDTATANYQVNVTANSSLTGVNLEFNGSTYALTDQGSGIWNYTQQVPTSAVGNQSVVFKYQYGAGTINGHTTYQLVNSTILALCNGTYTTRFLNVTFADENSLSAINASIPTSSWVYYLGNGTVNKTLTYSNASDNYNYSFCGTSGGLPLYVQPTVQYKQGTVYPQRIWIPAIQTYNSTRTTQVLYLLSSIDGLYVTFQVIDSSDATISGVEVNVSRVISGSTVQISSGTTDSGGLVTFWLNPDFQHTITFTKSGYTTYTTSLFPTQSSYTVTLGGTGTVTTDKTTGISYGIKPTDSFLTYFTVHDFEFSLGSTYWELDEFGFDLNWSNGTLIGSNSSTTSSGGTISIQDFNVSNGSAIVMTPYYTIDSVKYTLQPRFWYLQSSEGREFSLYQWFGDFTTYTSTGTSVLGFNDFGKLLLTALVLILLVGGLSQRYGLQSESAITGIIFSVIFFLEYTLEWIPLITTPLGTLPRGTLTIVSAIILIATMIAGERR